VEAKKRRKLVLRPVVLKNSRFKKSLGERVENVQQIENVVYRASYRDEISA
jgi:hypothetical protein